MLFITILNSSSKLDLDGNTELGPLVISMPTRHDNSPVMTLFTNIIYCIERIIIRCRRYLRASWIRFLEME